MFGYRPHMGNAGSPGPRLRRAIATRNMLLVETSALEVRYVDLKDALAIVSIMAETDDPRFERAAAKWLARVSAERRLSLAEIRRASALLEVLPNNPQAVEQRLRAYCGFVGPQSRSTGLRDVPSRNRSTGFGRFWGASGFSGR